MDIQAEKITLAQLLLQTEDVTIIKKVKAIFNAEKKDFWDELSQEQKDDINEGIKDADEGRIIPFENVMKKYI